MKKKLMPSVCWTDKIKSYMESVSVKIPLPVKCTIEERKGRKHAKLHFACQVKNKTA
jgi:hypothetical protein